MVPHTRVVAVGVVKVKPDTGGGFAEAEATAPGATLPSLVGSTPLCSSFILAQIFLAYFGKTFNKFLAFS